MSIINRHERCVGIRLWKSKTRFIQLWYCPRGYEVKPHSHNDQHIELMYLFGKTTFFRATVTGTDSWGDPKVHNSESFTPKWWNIFRCFTVTPWKIHWFKVSNLPLVFINFARFVDGAEPVSAAIDFHQYTK